MDARQQTLARKSLVVVVSDVPDNAATPVTIRSLIEAHADPAMTDAELSRIVGVKVIATDKALQFGRVAGHMGSSATHVTKVAANGTWEEPACDAHDWLIQAQGAADSGATLIVYHDG